MKAPQPANDDDEFARSFHSNQPFVTWCITTEAGQRVVLIEYDNRNCDFPFAQERIFPI